MRLLPLLALVALAGCDLFGGGPDEAYMDRLDGTWTLAAYDEVRILDDGSTTTHLALTDAGTFEFAPTVTCQTGFVLEGGDSFSRAYLYDGDPRVQIPNVTGDCGIIFADDPATRINFIATFAGDVLMTIDEDGANRQVWSRYALFESEGYVLHTRYTLERQ